MDNWVLSAGNQYDGTTLFGPFADAEEADQYALDNGVHEYHLIMLNEPV